MRHATPRHSKGLAGVLVLFAIVGIVAAMLIYNSLGTVSKRMDATQTSAASFQKIHDALARFVMLNQRLPCPASGTAHTGDADPNSATVTCNSANAANGIVPWNTLGLEKTDALDPWGRYVFYRVYDGAGGFTQANGLKLTDCLDETVSTIYSLSGTGGTCNSNTHENTVSDFFNGKGLWVNDMGAQRQAAYVLISAGESGLGAFYPGAIAALTAPNAASSESLNAGSAGAKCGISTTQECWIKAASSSDVSASDASHFDDVASYVYANDIAKHAQLAGRPWKLYQAFSQTAVGLTGSNYNTGSSSMKIQPSSAGANQGPVVVTAGADTSRVLCVTNMSTQGLSPCSSGINNGSDALTTANNEYLTFDFRVTRKMVVIALTDFRYTGPVSSPNRERAQVTFYDSAGNQVGTAQPVQACSSGGNQVAQFTLTATGDFTKVKVSALTESTSANSSDFGVAAILACKLTADCPIGIAPTGLSWPTINCFG